jgi:hypothetical protein
MTQQIPMQTARAAQPARPGSPTDSTVVMTSVMADMKKPFMRVTNRWEYFERFLPWWKQYIRYRLYAFAFAAVGVLTLLSNPLIGIVCLAAAAYYWELHLLRKMRLESKRSLIIGH